MWKLSMKIKSALFLQSAVLFLYHLTFTENISFSDYLQIKPCKYGDYNSILNLDFAHWFHLPPRITFSLYNFRVAVYWSFSHWDDLSINLFFVCTFRKLFWLGLSGRILLFLVAFLLLIGHYAFFMLCFYFVFNSYFCHKYFFASKTCLSLSLIINSVSNTVLIQVNSLANDLISSFSSIDIGIWLIRSSSEMSAETFTKRIW